MIGSPGVLGGSNKTSGWQKPQPRQNDDWAAAVERAKQVDCIELVGRYVARRKCGPGEHEGPCPKCAGENRLHVKRDGWFCRQCKPLDVGGHGWHDAPQFLVFARGLTFPQAVAELTGATPGDTHGFSRDSHGQRVQPQPERKPEPQTTEWRARVEPTVTAARLALAGDNAGMAYLTSRGILPATAQVFGWGFGVYKDKLVIVIPWWRGAALWAVRYRYLMPGDGPKIVSETGSKFAGGMYGGQCLCGCQAARRTLVICEGEINAASIWQAARDSYLDVLSTGSESHVIPPTVLDYAGKYRQVVVWMDKLDIARKWAVLIDGATAVASPQGKDANDLLQGGRLGSFLAHVRAQGCATPVQVKALRFDLYDQHELYGGLEDGAFAVLCELAGR